MKFSKESIKHHNVAIFIMLITMLAMGLEMTGTRSGMITSHAYFGSIFSFEYIRRIRESAIYIFSHDYMMNKYVIFTMAIIIFSAIIIYVVKPKSRSNKAIVLSLKCLISSVFSFIFYVLLAAKVGPSYLSSIRCSYGVFFFLILFISLISIYVLMEIKQSQFLLPFILMILFLTMLNSSWPYRKASAGSENFFVHKFIPALYEASNAGYNEIDLYIPNEATFEKWELDCLADTLYNHKIIPAKIRINELKSSIDGGVYARPNPNPACDGDG